MSTAAQTYFGKQLKDVTIAEAAMLAGLPKAPSAMNTGLKRGSTISSAWLNSRRPVQRIG